MFSERWALSIALGAAFVTLSAISTAEEVPAAAAPAESAAPRKQPLDTWGTDDPAPVSAPGASTPPPPEAGPATPPSAPERDESARSDAARANSGGVRRDGPAVRYTLEALEIRGNARTSSRVILRYLPFQRGDVLDVDDPAVELARFRLLGTGFFQDVQFSLRKGTDRGLVVLVIDVIERNTIVFNDISMGLWAKADSHGRPKRAGPYAGLDVAETNLGGTGITLGAAAAIAQSQRALRVRFLDPAFLGGPWMTSGSLLFTRALDSFGNADVKWQDQNARDATSPAVVRYRRFGGSLGIGRDLSLTTQLWLHYRLETVDANFPLQASHLRGFAREPIDFHIVRGRSLLSTLGGTLQLDTRDHPILPTRGWFVTFRGEVSLPPASIDYDYQKFELDVNRWWRVPSTSHVVKLSAYAGGIAGNAPFFERFYVGDFTDFLPDRVLGMSFDQRPPPNFLGTDIVEVRYGDLALRLGGEYRVPLYRGHRSIYGIDAFVSGGFYSVAGRRDLTQPPVGYSGAARIPVDITANMGLRIDTSAGGFAFAFSNLLSLIPFRGKGPAGS